jgi:hypothetical protein
MVDLKSDPKTAPPASSSPATKPGANPTPDLSAHNLPNSVERGVDMMLKGPAVLPNPHSRESVAAKFGECTIDSVMMALEIGEKV